MERKGRDWNHLNPLPIKHIHDRWIGDYASSAIDLLARLESDLEMVEPPKGLESEVVQA